MITELNQKEVEAISGGNCAAVAATAMKVVGEGLAAVAAVLIFAGVIVAKIALGKGAPPGGQIV